jgi:RNA polymerase sigma-70 factor (ECF subfamily)
MAPPGSSSADDPDEDLMRAYASGAAGAFDALYARHKGPVYRYLLRHCQHAGTADELFQDVWMNVIRARASYAPTAKFTTWLYTLAHNRMVDHWRSQGRVALASLDAEDDDDARETVEAIPGARGDEPEIRVAAREIGGRLVQALAALPPAQRDAFLLHQEGGLSLAEIAVLTGVGAETAKSRVRYAVARLRTELADLL